MPKQVPPIFSKPCDLDPQKLAQVIMGPIGPHKPKMVWIICRVPKIWGPKVSTKLVFFSFFSAFFFFREQRTAQTGWPIFTVNSSNNVFWRKDVPFGGSINQFLILGAWPPKNLVFWGHFCKITLNCECCIWTSAQAKPADQILRLIAHMTYFLERYWNFRV